MDDGSCLSSKNGQHSNSANNSSKNEASTDDSESNKMTTRKAPARAKEFILHGPQPTLNLSNYSTACPIGLFVTQDDHHDWNLKTDREAVFRTAPTQYRDIQMVNDPKCCHYPYSVEVIQDEDKEKYGF